MMFGRQADNGDDYEDENEPAYEPEKTGYGTFGLRFLFAFLGALGCVLAALGLEYGFQRAHLAQTLDDRVSRVLIIQSDIGQRLERAGGQTGEVTITLSWNNYNDLDLWCIDPRGEKIFYSHKRARSGGVLDVDSNSGEHPLTDRPVENIVWPYGSAPAGKYQVFVDHYSTRRGQDPTAYKVSVLVKGRQHDVTGSISHGGGARLVYEFDTSGTNSEWNGLFPAILRAMLLTAFWTSLLGLLFTVVVMLGQWVFYRQYLGERFLTLPGAILLAAWGALAGAIAGAIGQLVFSLLAAYVAGVSVPLGRDYGWVVLGAVFGWLIARRMPNLPPRAAFVGGLVGGIWAAVVFVASLQDSSGGWGRVAGAALVGAFVGFMIVLEIPFVEPEEVLEDLRMHIAPLSLRPQRGRPMGTLRHK